MRFAIIAASLLAVIAAPAMADDAKKLGTYHSWEGYAYSDAGGKVCYAAARADKPNGGDKDRVAAAIAVTHRPKSPGEVSLIGSFGFKKDSEAEIQIGAMKHTFFTKGSSAWAKDASADKAIVAALLKSKDVVVKGHTAKNQAIADTVSLKGFPEALAAIDKACGVKR